MLKSARALMLMDVDVAKRLDGYLRSNYFRIVEEIPDDKMNCGFTSILAGLQNVRPSYKVKYLKKMMTVNICQNVKQRAPRIQAYLVTQRRIIREWCEVMLSEEKMVDLVVSKVPVRC